jgi:putative protease
LAEAVSYAHVLGKKVYIALNILAHDKEIKALPQFIEFLDSIKVDAVIVADLGIMDLVREHSSIPIHVSTQASATNWRSVKMYQSLGAKRVVLAREVTLSEVKKIKDQVPDMEIELFVHGAMCMAYSGRCNLSNYFSSRDGNRGVCSNTCRWKYSVVEEKRPGEYFPVYEDDTGTYLYNSKDLCTIEFLDKILDAGVSGLKIEGRMKSHYYVANSTKIYREALDAYNRNEFVVDPRWKHELEKMSHRGYTTGFYLGQLDKNSEQFSGNIRSSHRFAGIVRERVGDDRYLIETREKFHMSESVEILRPEAGGNPLAHFSHIVNVKNNTEIATVQPNLMITVASTVPLEPLDMVVAYSPTTEPINAHLDPAMESCSESEVFEAEAAL